MVAVGGGGCGGGGGPGGGSGGWHHHLSSDNMNVTDYLSTIRIMKYYDNRLKT